jgi:hypothetical protein
MDDSETLATLDTHDTARRQKKKQKTKQTNKKQNKTNKRIKNKKKQIIFRQVFHQGMQILLPVTLANNLKYKNKYQLFIAASTLSHFFKVNLLFLFWGYVKG